MSAPTKSVERIRQELHVGFPPLRQAIAELGVKVTLQKAILADAAVNGFVTERARAWFTSKNKASVAVSFSRACSRLVARGMPVRFEWLAAA